jgi:hypothetical protein
VEPISVFAGFGSDTVLSRTTSSRTETRNAGCSIIGHAECHSWPSKRDPFCGEDGPCFPFWLPAPALWAFSMIFSLSLWCLPSGRWKPLSSPLDNYQNVQFCLFHMLVFVASSRMHGEWCRDASYLTLKLAFCSQSLVWISLALSAFGSCQGPTTVRSSDATGASPFRIDPLKILSQNQEPTSLAHYVGWDVTPANLSGIPIHTISTDPLWDSGSIAEDITSTGGERRFALAHQSAESNFFWPALGDSGKWVQ